MPVILEAFRGLPSGHKAWPGSQLIVVDNEGHGGRDMQSEWRRALRELSDTQGWASSHPDQRFTAERAGEGHT